MPVRRFHPAAFWGIIGVCMLLLNAIRRVAPIALEPVQNQDMNSAQWLLMLGWMAVMLYSEGYRGFQKAFSPRVVSRALSIGERPSWLRVLFAPFFCIGLFGATRARMIKQWMVLTIIISVIVAIRFLPYPYRGILDAGVVAGLAYGVISVPLVFARALSTGVLPADPELG